MNPPNQVVAVFNLDPSKLKHETGEAKRLDGIADILNKLAIGVFPGGTLRFDYLYVVAGNPADLEAAIAEDSINLHEYAVDHLGEACHTVNCERHGDLRGYSFGVQQGHA